MESVYSGTEMRHRVRSSDALKKTRVRRELQIYIISWLPHHPNCEKSSLALSLVVSNCSLSIQRPIAPIRLLAAFFSSCTQHAIFLFRLAAPLGPRLTCFSCMRQAVHVWRPPTDHRPYRRTSGQRGDVQRRLALVRLRAAAVVIEGTLTLSSCVYSELVHFRARVQKPQSGRVVPHRRLWHPTDGKQAVSSPSSYSQT